jgi:hypothetical protein
MSASDLLANVAGYLPVGLVLSELGLARTMTVAALMSFMAEALQLAIVHRAPSIIDVGSNAIGALLGALAASRWTLRLSSLTVDRRAALISGALACALIGGVWASPRHALNSRGATSPGTLEAYWKLDEPGGSVAFDASANALIGTFNDSPSRVAGILGGAVQFNGSTDEIDFGRSTALRLAGSMTISAWTKSSSFPVDDAAIVSNHDAEGQGYQLDTTVDKGPRTIGFKLANECGQLMARYGATPLVVGTWYHVAGVYDARARTLDVYLNGRLDNGFLLGAVTGMQRSSRERVYVGRRSNPAGFAFAGSIDDVRIYSQALDADEIVADMRGARLDDGARAQGAAADAGENGFRATDLRRATSPCAIQSDRKDKELPVVAAAVGVLIAVAVSGLLPSSGWLPPLVAALATGFLLLLASAATLPVLGLCAIPSMSLAGAASVVASRSH